MIIFRSTVHAWRPYLKVNARLVYSPPEVYMWSRAGTQSSYLRFIRDSIPTRDVRTSWINADSCTEHAICIPHREKKTGKRRLTMLITASRNTLRIVGRTTQVRYSSGIKLLNERAKAEEDYYFSKQDGT